MSSGWRPWVSATMIEKIIVVAPTTAVPMSTGFAVALNVFPAPSFSSRFSLARSKSGVEAEVLLDLRLDARAAARCATARRHGLRVVGHRPVGIHRDGHRPHPQEPERHQAEREHRGRDHQAHRGPSVLTPYATAISGIMVRPSQ